MYNHCALEARITGDPVLLKTKNNIPYVLIRLACPRNHKVDGDSACDFLSCKVWRSQAEFVAANFKKGSAILVAGRLENIPKKDAQGNYTDNVILNATDVNFCGYPRSSEE